MRARSGFKRYFTRRDKEGRVAETGPFYSMFNVGDYTFAPWKVVWPWISKSLVPAVVSSDSGGKTVLPEHNTSFVPFDRRREAFYFCGCFGSSIVDLAAISSYSGGGGGIGSPAIVERIHVPRFDCQNPLHLHLAALSEKAHEATATGDEAEVERIEAEIDRAVAELWGLREEELAEVQRSLEELR